MNYMLAKFSCRLEERANLFISAQKTRNQKTSAPAFSLFVELGSACSEFVFACLFGEVVGLDEALCCD